jgi:hypothetical protein
LQRYVLELAAALSLPAQWQWGLAAYVSQIGCVTLPQEILSKVEASQALTDEEKRLFESHPEVAGKLLAAIPRLDDVAAIVTAQFDQPNCAGKPDNISHWDIRSAGELLLKTACEFDRLITRGASRESAAVALKASKPGLPQAIIKALLSLKIGNQGLVIRQVRLKDLALGMILDEDLVSPKGIRLVPSGQEITRTLIVRLSSIADGVGVVEPFRVRVSA